MNFKILFGLFLLLITQPLHAQKEASNWYFGDGAGLSFNSGNPVPLFNGRLQTIEGSASISDRNGNLLFYTDGITVYDRSHQVMLNGTDLKGNVSTTQSAIIVPRPASPGRYFIFTVDKPDYFRITTNPIEGVHFSEVDMSLNNGLGGIIPGQKNIQLQTWDPSNPKEVEFKSSEKITAVISGDCISYWVVTQLGNKFYSFNVNSSGVDTNPIISSVSSNFQPLLNDQDINVTAAGYMKISPDGTRLAAAYVATGLGSPRTGGAKKTGKAFVYDFNDLTGKVSNQELILANAYPYGVEFSPDSKKLYITSNTFSNDDILQTGELYQFDVSSSNPQATKNLIHTSTNVAGALQLSIDGKIYRAGYPKVSGAVHHNFLSVINKPNLVPASIDYRHNSVNISPKDVKLGLPPFVQSLFNSTFDYENICFGNVTEFTLNGSSTYDSVTWDFGDGSNSSAPSPTHTYTNPGTYIVSLIKTINGIPQDPVCEEITIYEIPSVPPNYVLKQCDSQDGNPNDGLAEFNLQLAKGYLTQNDPSLQVYFYEDRNTAINDDKNQNALNNIYRNTSANQQLFAKITGFGSSCYNITTIELQTTISVDLDPSPVGGCDIGGGEAEFNFITLEQNIIKELGLNTSISLSFYEDEEDATTGVNALPLTYTSEPKTIYIRADSNNSCYGFGSIELTLNSFPEILQSRELSGCANNFPLELGDEITLPNPAFYSFNWSTGENTSTIEVNASGIYTLSLTNTKFGCGRDITYTIEKFDAPKILDVSIENHGTTNSINILLETEDPEALYSLDDINGPYQSSPEFNNIPGGTHTVYVKNDKACDIAEKSIFLFGFPGYFTPNNDGYNDTWQPYEIKTPEFQIKEIMIYDRYGQLLKQLGPGEKWDGIFNGHPMPSNDYWFGVTLKNGRVYKGHFSLVR